MRTAKTDWRLVSAALAVGAALTVFLPGCGSLTAPPDYPPEMTFPPREDRLVLSLPDREASGPGEQGKLEQEIAGLDAIGGKTADPATVPAQAREALNATLTELFGTPAAPTIAGEEHTTAESLGLTAERLAAGGKLFRRHCINCHGLSGDGRGTTGPFIFPHPRDFRRGAFKFVSTGDGAKPHRTDLLRTIRDGIKGTAMPSFAMLSDDNRDLLAGYVTFLSVRGQTEFEVLRALLTDELGPEEPLADYARARASVIVKAWANTSVKPIPPETPTNGDSVRRGYELFTAATGSSCISCHKDFGRQSTFRYDVWGTVARPANLTQAAKKGGTEPANLYHRIRDGIHPVGMPSQPLLTDTQVWDLVHFIRALPQPQELPEDVRAKVYPKP